LHGRVLTVPLRLSPVQRLRAVHASVVTAHPGATGLDFAGALFGETCPRHVASTLLPAFTADRPDLVVYEVLDIGAAIAADVLGIPAVAFGLGLRSPILDHWHDTAVRSQRDRWADPPRLLRDYLDPVPPSLQPDASSEGRIAIRPVPWSEFATVPSWPDNRRQRVYVTLGTVVFGAVEVLRRAVLESAAHDARTCRNRRGTRTATAGT
jgi:hypothetical protein